MRENIYINKKSEKKYEIITKEIDLEPGVYTLFALEKNLFVIKKQFYNDNSSYSKKETEKKEEPKQGQKDTKQNNIEEEVILKQKEEPIKEINIKQEDKIGESTQEWYKKALEFKTKLNMDQFMVLQDIEEVRKISYVTRQEINSGEIIGIRGFDKNYYIFKRALFERLKSNILDSMNSKPITYDDLLEKVKAPKEQLNGIIELLKEQGDIIETRKGIFKKV